MNKNDWWNVVNCAVQAGTDYMKTGTGYAGAVKAADILRGKHRVDFVPHLDDGDYVVIINAAHYKVSGNKLDQKKYYRHSGHAGKLKEIPLKRMQEKHPLKVVYNAISGMVPRNRLKKPILAKLYLFPDSEHSHEAQKPEEITVS